MTNISDMMNIQRLYLDQMTLKPFLRYYINGNRIFEIGIDGLRRLHVERPELIPIMDRDISVDGDILLKIWGVDLI